MIKTLSSGVVIRSYKSCDDAACKDLETSGRMRGSLLQRIFFRLEFRHYVEFDSKARQYENSKVIVAEDDGRVVGAVCVVMKTVTLKGESRKAGYLFDLRIHEDVQGKGLGIALSTAAEEWAWENKADFIYLTVNSNNERAVGLYGKLGYKLVSYSKPVDSLLFGAAWGGDDLRVRRIEGPEAVETIKKYTSGCDMFPGIEKLVSSEYYLGTFIITDVASGSVAGVSLWNGAGVSGFRVAKFILPSWVLGSIPFQAAVFGAAFLLICHFSRASYASYTVNEPFASFTAALASVSLIAATCLAYSFTRFATGIFAHPAPRLRSRIFAPFHSGPLGPTLFSALIRQVRRVAAGKGFALFTCNLDQASPLRRHFGIPKYSTQFHAKGRAGREVGMLGADNFFDPRDI